MVTEATVVKQVALRCADATPRVDREGKAEVLYDFQGAEETELTVFAGQTVRPWLLHLGLLRCILKLLYDFGRLCGGSCTHQV